MIGKRIVWVEVINKDTESNLNDIGTLIEYSGEVVDAFTSCNNRIYVVKDNTNHIKQISIKSVIRLGYTTKEMEEGLGITSTNIA